MGELEGVKNAWGYPEGGNGAVSMAIARAAEAHGAVINTNSVSVCVCLSYWVFYAQEMKRFNLITSVCILYGIEHNVIIEPPN